MTVSYTEYRRSVTCFFYVNHYQEKLKLCTGFCPLIEIFIFRVRMDFKTKTEYKIGALSRPSKVITTQCMIEFTSINPNVLAKT